jgi:hypothetical protein
MISQGTAPLRFASTLTPPGGAETSKAPLRRRVELLQSNKAPWGAGQHMTMSSDEFYCMHVEQLGLRYPDAVHVRYAWGVDKRRIESKVMVSDAIDMFISVLEPDGTVRHFAQPYKK